MADQNAASLLAEMKQIYNQRHVLIMIVYKTIVEEEKKKKIKSV